MAVRASIVGGSGYAGGELLRLLLGHPQVEVAQVTSQRFAGRFVHGLHPNLRGATSLKFSSRGQLRAHAICSSWPCPTAVPRSRSNSSPISPSRIIDLSADFRLRDADQYETWYGRPHGNPEWLEQFVYGLPELHREELRQARLRQRRGLQCDGRQSRPEPARPARTYRAGRDRSKSWLVGSGQQPGLAGHHPERSGCVRSFAPTGHRHQAEMIQELGQLRAPLFGHGRGNGARRPQHRPCLLVEDLGRARYLADLPRCLPTGTVHSPGQGSPRYLSLSGAEDPLAGTNFCDIGFAKDPGSNRLVVISAIDNLMKGAAGSAVQAMNVMMGWDERTRSRFRGSPPNLKIPWPQHYATIQRKE